jgi:hypothetical protein
MTADNVLECEKGSPIHFVKALQLLEVKEAFASLTEEECKAEYNKYYERVESPKATMSCRPRAHKVVSVIEEQVCLVFDMVISPILTLRHIKMKFLWFHLAQIFKVLHIFCVNKPQ